MTDWLEIMSDWEEVVGDADEMQWLEPYGRDAEKANRGVPFHVRQMLAEMQDSRTVFTYSVEMCKGYETMVTCNG